MNVEQLGETFERYLAGTASAAEKEWIGKWLQERPEDHHALEPRHRQAVHSAIWQSVSRKTNLHLRPVNNHRKWLAYAAAAALLVATAAWMLLSRQTPPAAFVQTIVTQPGSPKTVYLPDSSVVHLFPGATLTIPDNYNVTDRRIALSGRGFFDVKENPSRAFFVRVGKLTTQVLGTSFEVKSTDSLSASVIVRTGKVGVAFDGKHLANLTPGRRLRYNAQQRDYTVDAVDAALLCEWWSRGMVFDQAPLAEVVQSLSDWYNVPVEIRNTRWQQETVTIRIRRQSCTEAIALLSETLGFRYKRENDRIIIY
ncbi:FecR family protein [Chitinophaga rhizosphaerae]|uniref:FecR family protein n=1 Tax=Chitinophaga rhizosphaerae TaxID=1864947 RepID=UPI000F810B62|nr:FecR domain-containing protein [Chitinophaga rhizosphaerae]